MSYGFSLTVPAGRFADVSNYSRVLDAFEDYAMTLSFGDAADAARDHIEMAAEAVDHLSSVCGSRGVDELSVSISGHANPGHHRTEGFADEIISVVVAVKRSVEAFTVELTELAAA